MGDGKQSAEKNKLIEKFKKKAQIKSRQNDSKSEFVHTNLQKIEYTKKKLSFL